MASTPTDAHDAYLSVRRFTNLDGLRCICIAMVLWHHATPIDLPGLKLENRGFLGVDFFFILSGYLITTLLLREDARYGDISLRDFYLRRAIRIVPVYFFVVTGVAGYFIVLQGESQYLDLLPFYYLFLSNFLVGDIPTLGPTWSLAIEEQYYLIWPLVLMILLRRRLALVLVVLIVGIVLASASLGSVSAGPLLLHVPNYAPILMGSLAAVLLHRRTGFLHLWPFVSHPFAPVLAALSLIITVELLPDDLRGVPGLIVHVLMTLTLITLVVRERTVFSPLLTHPLVAGVGAISYGVYLYHLLALDAANRALSMLDLSGEWTVFLCYTLLSCFIAEVSYRTLEAWFRRFRPPPRDDGVAHKDCANRQIPPTTACN